MLPISLIFLGIFSRLIVHVPNYTPVLAVALFGGVYLNKRYAIVVPLLLMIASDLILGLHNTIGFTWGDFVVKSPDENDAPLFGTDVSFLGCLLSSFIASLLGRQGRLDFTALASCMDRPHLLFRFFFLGTSGKFRLVDFSCRPNYPMGYKPNGSSAGCVNFAMVAQW